jgi:hypothetical protein
MLGIVLSILYFTLTRAVINITPQLREISSEFYLDVGDSSAEVEALLASGDMNTEVIEKTVTFEATGSKVIEPSADGDSIGTVTLVNNLNRKLDLIQKTRLLSEDGTLLRLSERATVPPLSSLSVKVYADDPDSFTELEIGRLTVPGLGKNMEDKVFAENKQKISTEAREVNIIAKEDFENAVLRLSTEMRQEALNEMKVNYGQQGPVVLALSGDVIEKTASLPIGAEAEEFEVTVKMKVVSVFLNKSEVHNLVDQELQEALGAGEDLVKADFKETTYTIEKYDTANKSAHIKVTAKGYATIGENHIILDKEKFIGANKEQVEIYFKSYDEVKDVDVMFTPFWVTKVPSMHDKIEINVR